MDDKEFRKLRREDLIEIIYQYQRREQRLIAENENLRAQLEDRRIRMEKTGSIAEASLALSGIFAAAQRAADLYLQSVREQAVRAADPPSVSAAESAQPVPAQKPEEGKTSQDVRHTAKSTPAPVKPSGKQQSASEKTEEPPKAIYPAGKNPAVSKSQQSPSRQSGPEAKKTQKPEAEKPQKNQTEKPAKAQTGKPVHSQTAAPQMPPPQKEETPGTPAPKIAETAKPAAAQKNRTDSSGAPGGDTDEFIASLKEYLGM